MDKIKELQQRQFEIESERSRGRSLARHHSAKRVNFHPEEQSYPSPQHRADEERANHFMRNNSIGRHEFKLPSHEPSPQKNQSEDK